ncbi:Hpt domain-containing protein [Patescibacteria group bacterium]|nr:Hpt domain-containing protein [Patescibacteria group bacterium]
MDDIKQFLEMYVSEVEERLQGLNNGLLNLEKDPQNVDIMNELMRHAHSIKGAAATMGFQSMTLFVHVIEDVFDSGRKKELTITPPIIQILFHAFDQLNSSLQEIKHNGKELDLSKEVEALQQRIQNGITDTEILEETPTGVQVSHIKVPVERLDTLMDLVEELLIVKMGFDEEISKEESYEKLKPLFRKFDRLSSDVQYSVMKARLVPVNQIFARFPRMVRDTATKEGKVVNFEMRDDNIELDRTIVDRIAEPLAHLLRNAIDHGIEKEGTIRLLARREQERAEIVVEDNGRGINLEEIISVATEKKIIDEAKAKDLRSSIRSQEPGIVPKNIAYLLFEPQFSSAKKVTEISGRGVGLNAVKDFIESVGGNILIERLEQGTRFTLELPITLAIVKALIVRISTSVYAIPLTSVERSVKLEANQIRTAVDSKVAVLGNEEYPLLFFNEEMEINLDQPLLTVLVRSGRDIIGLKVDELIKEQEIIVKPLSKLLRSVRGFSGVTILGGGETILILDIPGLVEQHKANILIT